MSKLSQSGVWFLRIIFISGGVICIFIPVSTLSGIDVATVILGIALTLMGVMNIFAVTKPEGNKKKEANTDNKAETSNSAFL
ncbi:MAG: hypothetical protein WHS88_12585 [Anaerohalosphaeraceae bacterium]